MRYITHSRIKPGMVLASPFYGPNFEVLLSKGMKLSANHIQRINDRGYSGAYIEDSLSEGIEVRDIVAADIRIDAVRMSREILQGAEKGGKIAGRFSQESQSRVIYPIIDSILNNRRRIVDMVDLKPFDDYMYYHNANVVILSLLVGVELGLSGPRLYELGLASLLHDVGNVFIPQSILNKPGKLSSGEFEIIKSHSEMGFKYLREHFAISIEGCMGALQHHENYDGTGYPNGLKKDEISIYGRIIAITDVYDALISRRPFRQPVMSPSAMDFMDAGAGTLFDPNVLDALKRVVALYPASFCVELDNGMTCIVVENHPGHPARPTVRPIGGSNAPGIINLHSDQLYRNVGVAEIIEI